MGNAQVKVRRPKIFREYYNSSSADVQSTSSSHASSNDGQSGFSHNSSDPAPLVEEFVDNRRVVKSSGYTFPVDPDWCDMGDLNHYLMRKYNKGKNIVTPYYPKNPKAILDIGAGNGSWAKEVAREFPKSIVYAMELVDDIFRKNSTPSNVIWDIGNINEGTKYASNMFDFIHMRMVVGGIPTIKMQQVCHEMYRMTAPGGSVCLVDPTNYYRNMGPYMKEWVRLLNLLCERSRVYMRIATSYEEYLVRAGFKDVKVLSFEYPIGAWQGEFGAINADIYKRVTQAFPVMMPDEITHEEATKLNEMTFDIEADQNRFSIEYVHVCARKP